MQPGPSSKSTTENVEKRYFRFFINGRGYFSPDFSRNVRPEIRDFENGKINRGKRTGNGRL